MNKSILRSLAGLLLGAAFAAQAQTTIDTMDLRFECTRPTVRDEAEVVAIPATEALTFKVWEVSATGVRATTPAVTGPACPLALKGVKGTKRYVMTVASDSNGRDSLATTPPVLVTSTAPKAPGAVQVRVVFTTTP